MSPPQLAAHAPVLDVAHPFEIRLRPVVRHETRAARFHGGDGGRGEGRDVHEPLIGEVGLEHRATAVAARHRQFVLLGACDEARRLELGEHTLARLEAVETAEALRHVGVECGARREDVDRRQTVPQPDLIVVEIVGGCDLEAPRAEGRIDVRVGDDRDRALGEGQAHGLADEMAVALVLGVHCHGGIAQHRFRARGGHHDVPRTVLQRVTQVPEMAVFLLALHFEVGHGDEQHGVPVDETLTAVDQALCVEAHEDFADGA